MTTTKLIQNFGNQLIT